MTINPLYRRRVERFAQLVDEVEGGRRHHVRSDLDGTLAPLVTLTKRMAAVPVSVAPDTEFRVGLRAMLLARIEREGIGDTAIPAVDPPLAPAPRHSVRPGYVSQAGALDTVAPEPVRFPVPPAPIAGPRIRRNRTRAAALIGVTVGALALSGVSGASDDAIPGDPLYSIKRSSERAQLALTSSNVSRGRLLLGFARIRLYEAQRANPELAHDALVDMRQQARDGLKALASAALDHRDAAALRAVDDFVAWARPQLLQLVGALPMGRQQDALDALRDLDGVGNRSAQLRATIACGASETMDEYGPLPRHCPAEQQRGSVGSQPMSPASAGSGGIAATAGAATPVAPPAGASSPAALDATTPAGRNAGGSPAAPGAPGQGNSHGKKVDKTRGTG